MPVYKGEFSYPEGDERCTIKVCTNADQYECEVCIEVE